MKNLLYGGYKAVNLIPCVVEREGGTDAYVRRDGVEDIGVIFYTTIVVEECMLIYKKR